MQVTSEIVAGIRQLIFRRVAGDAESEKWIMSLGINLEAINAEMKAFSEEGGSIVLPKGTFNIRRFPEVLNLLGVRPEQFGDLLLKQIPDELGNFTLQFMDNEDKSVLSLRTRMWIVSSGSDRIRLENRDDATALRILIEIHREPQRTTVTFTASLLGHNAYSAFRAVQFLDALSKPGRLTLFNDDTGLELVDGPTDKSSSKVSELELKILEKLAQIQQKAGQQIMINREILASDLSDIESAYVAITEGRLYFKEGPVTMNTKPDFTFNPDVPGWNSLVIEPSIEERAIVVLDNKIDLGETEIVVKKAIPKVEQDRKVLKLFPAPGEPFYLNFVRYSGRSEKPDISG